MNKISNCIFWKTEKRKNIDSNVICMTTHYIKKNNENDLHLLYQDNWHDMIYKPTT